MTQRKYEQQDQSQEWSFKRTEKFLIVSLAHSKLETHFFRIGHLFSEGSCLEQWKQNHFERTIQMETINLKCLNLTYSSCWSRAKLKKSVNCKKMFQLFLSPMQLRRWSGFERISLFNLSLLSNVLFLLKYIHCFIVVINVDQSFF